MWEKLKEVSWGEECVQLEHDVAFVISLQEKAGIYFDIKKAGLLHADLLQEQEKIGDELKEEVRVGIKIEDSSHLK